MNTNKIDTNVYGILIWDQQFLAMVKRLNMKFAEIPEHCEVYCYGIADSGEVDESKVYRPLKRDLVAPLFKIQ
jgi:hypothetical protein